MSKKFSRQILIYYLKVRKILISNILPKGSAIALGPIYLWVYLLILAYPHVGTECRCIVDSELFY
jgi:hypothetical protein